MKQLLKMGHRTWLALAALSATLTATGLHAAAPPAEAFFQEPNFQQARLSPDGRKVAMLIGAKDKRRRLAVLDLNTMKPTVAADFDERDVAWHRWVNDDRLVFRLEWDVGEQGLAYGGPGLFAVNADGSDYRPLVQTRRAWVNAPDAGVPLLRGNTFVVAVPGHHTGSHIFVGRVGEASREKIDYIDVELLNTRTGRVTNVDLPLHARHWVIGHDGKPVAVQTVKGGRHAWHLLQSDGSWQKGPEFDPVVEGGPALQWQGPDGKLYGLANHQGTDAVFEFNTATGLPQGKPLASSPHFDIVPTYVGNSQRLLGLRYTVDAEVTQWLDKDMQALQALVDKLLPATSNRLSVPWHGDSPWVLVQAFADVQPTVSYIFNRETSKLARLGSALPALSPSQLGQTDFFRIAARDGLPIPTYLTLPPGGGKKLPMVVLVHGGPWVRGGHWAFDREVQFLASRGYAVLQPEFRGSAGFGRRHWVAGFKQWGLAMQDDVADATRWAIAQGHADPARICIAGASYGGYAVLMGLARDNDLYRCGINWVGVTDPALLFSSGWSDIRGEYKTHSMPQMIGDPVADAALLKAASALEHASKVKRPLLMAYGGLDTRVPAEHGKRFLDAVKPHNPDVEWVVYPNEGHGWFKLENQLDFWSRVERHLARNIGKP